MLWLGNTRLGQLNTQPETEEQFGLGCILPRQPRVLQPCIVTALGLGSTLLVPFAPRVGASSTSGGWKAAEHLPEPWCSWWCSALETSGAPLALLHLTSATRRSCSEGWPSQESLRNRTVLETWFLHELMRPGPAPQSTHVSPELALQEPCWRGDTHAGEETPRLRRLQNPVQKCLQVCWADAITWSP